MVGSRQAGMIWDAARPAGCHCLCTVNHSGVDDVCAGTADTSLTFNSPVTGKVDVQMCAACAAATLAEARR